MSKYHFQLEATEEMYTYLETLPVVGRRVAFERAIHEALDAEGWPRGDRGEMPIPADYWYVVVYTRSGAVRGHVGPISDEDKAKLAARSWATAGNHATVKRAAIGPCLTNAY